MPAMNNIIDNVSLVPGYNVRDLKPYSSDGGKGLTTDQMLVKVLI